MRAVVPFEPSQRLTWRWQGNTGEGGQAGLGKQGWASSRAGRGGRSTLQMASHLRLGVARRALEEAAGPGHAHDGVFGREKLLNGARGVQPRAPVCADFVEKVLRSTGRA